MLTIGRIFADQLGAEVVIDRYLDLLERMAEEADVDLGLAYTRHTLIGFDLHEHVLQDG